MKTHIGERPVQTEEPDLGRALSLTTDPAGVLALMDALISLYSNGEQAILREYTSNGRDASKKAGWHRPVEVTLPTTGNPILSIEDWGIGMSAEEILNKYSELGTSDKRDDNDAIGSFGFGSKSALMMATRFDFISRKDGIEVHGHCEKKNGGYYYYIDGQEPTTEHSGFRVEIPGLRPEHLKEDDLLDTFFIGYAQGTILINGKAPKRSLNNPEQFTPLMEGESIIGWVSKEEVEKKNRWDYYTGKVYGIVEDVVYQIQDSSSASYAALHNVFKQYGRIVYLNIPNGSVKMTPSREALIYNETTNGTLRRVFGDLKGVMEQAVQNRINLAPTRTAALAAYAEEKAGKFWGANLNYRGGDFPEEVKMGDDRAIYRLSHTVNGRSQTTKNELSVPPKFNLLEYAAMKPVIVLQREAALTDGIDSLRRRFNAYRAASADAPKTVLFVRHGAKLNEWIEACASRVISEEDYVLVAKGEQMALRANRKGAPRTAAKWHVLTTENRFRAFEQEEIKGKSRVLYMTRDMNLGYGLMSGGIKESQTLYLGAESQAILQVAGFRRVDTVIVGISVASRLKAFLKAFPEARSMQEFVKEEAARIAERRDAAGIGGAPLRAALLNQAELRHRNGAFVEFARKVDVKRLTNATQRTFFTTLAADPSTSTSEAENTVLRWAAVQSSTDAKISEEAERLAKIVNSMPLFPSERHQIEKDGMVEHIVNYLNSIR